MKKLARQQATKKRKVRSEDAQLREFHSKDLGDDLRKSGAGRLIQRKILPTSLVLEPDLVRVLREKGSRRGLGYQTMLKLIVREHLHEY